MRDQTAKTVARALYEWFIAVFGAPTNLLSDCGANFTSTLVEELCATLAFRNAVPLPTTHSVTGRWSISIRPCFKMMGKLTSDKKAHWEQHLPELLQAVTGYSLHYLMFGRHLCLPVDFYFPTMSTHMCSHCVPMYIEEVRKCIKEVYAEVHLQTNSEVDQQKWYYDRATTLGPA